mmetsp:Transcript_785/g.2044  ORF Transcript_785/g.2044 Transcript_785/m.2044 type:complete len:263 (+) Transcript_785:4425-5213(+)
MCTCAMCAISACRTESASSSWISNDPIKCSATAVSACCGHGRNQSTVQPLIRAGNLCARVRNLSPTGEKQRTIWRFARTRSMKKDHKSSAVGSSSGCARDDLAYSTALSPRITSTSSRGNKFGSSPVFRKMLMYSKNDSSLISLSVKMKVAPRPVTPACLYRGLKSSSKLMAEYCLLMVAWKKVAPATYEASRVSVCLPEPPTPTNSAEPRGVLKMRQIRMKWSSASSKSTMSLAYSLCASLKRPRKNCSRDRNEFKSLTGS